MFFSLQTSETRGWWRMFFLLQMELHAKKFSSPRKSTWAFLSDHVPKSGLISGVALLLQMRSVLRRFAVFPGGFGVRLISKNPEVSDMLRGTVVVNFGHRVLVENEQDKSLYGCTLSGNSLSVLCGDVVRWTTHEQYFDHKLRRTGRTASPTLARLEGDGLIFGIEPRRNMVSRAHRYEPGEKHPLASNIDHVFVVMSREPEPSLNTHLLDRVLATLHTDGLSCSLILNKSDLPGSQDEFKRLCEIYATPQLGYRVIRCSTKLPQMEAELFADEDSPILQRQDHISELVNFIQEKRTSA